MAGAPEYTSQVAAPAGPRETIAPLNAPYTGGTEAGQQALSQLGGEISDVAGKVVAAQKEATAIEATTNHLTQLDEIKTKYLRDPDYEGAPANFQKEAAQLELDSSAGISDPLARAKARLTWRQKAITDYNDIRTTSLTRQKDAVAADLDTQGVTNINDAATASSPVARQAAIDRQNSAVDGAAGKLWISKVDAETRKRQFGSELAEIDARRGMQGDPATVAAALEDSKQFPGLDPKRREVLIAEAHAKADQLGVLRQGAIAVVAPDRAALNIGRVATPDLADPVFDKLPQTEQVTKELDLTPQEQALYQRHLTNLTGPGGVDNPDGSRSTLFQAVQEHDGRFYSIPTVWNGRIETENFTRPSDGKKFQVPNSTALANVERVGWKNFPSYATPEEADARYNQLHGYMEQDTEKYQSGQLGRGYFRQLVGRYADTPVQIAAAAAAYNAGPDRTDKWIDAARAQFGPSFTAAQFQSVIDDKGTRDYVGNLYKKSNADMGGAGLSPAAQYHAAAAAKAAQAGELADQRHAVIAVADAARITDNPELLMGDGMTPDPVKLGQYKLIQAQAAAAGDVGAAKNLREIGLREDVLPAVRQIQRMPTGQAEEFVTAAETALATSPAPTLEQRTKVHFFRDALDRTKQLAATDPVALAERTGMVPLTAIDPQANAADPGFAAALTKRAATSRVAADFYGVADKPFKPQEAATLKDRFANAGPNEQADLIATLGKAMGSGPSYHAALGQIGADKPVYALAGEIAATRPDLAREILHGVPLLKEKDTADKSALVSQVLADKLGGQLYPSGEQQEQLVQAATALDASRRSAAGALYASTDASGIGRAIDDIAGTTVVRNGVKVPLPPTMHAADAADLINHFGERELQLSGGAIDRNGKAMTAADINAHGKWRPRQIGGTTYSIDMPAAGGDAPVMNYNGRNLVIDLATLAAPVRSAANPLQRAYRGAIADVGKPRPDDRRPAPAAAPPEPEPYIE